VAAHELGEGVEVSLLSQPRELFIGLLIGRHFEIVRSGNEATSFGVYRVSVNVLSLFMKPWVATCRETRDRLSDYLEGDLGRRARTRIRRHLARCEHCQALLASLTRTLEQVRSLGGMELGSQEPATVRAVIERIEREPGLPRAE
jgi:hypothetical protein